MSSKVSATVGWAVCLAALAGVGATCGGEPERAATQVEAGSDAGPADAGDPCTDPARLRADALENGTQILNGVSLSQSTPIADIAQNPAAYEGQVVQIEGWATDMCQARGCWVKLEDERGFGLILKVTDGVIDFRNYVTLGQYVVGEGVFSTSGHHGAQVLIDDHGAMVGTITCTR